MLLTTHYMDEAERLCDIVGIVDEGRMIAEGAPRDLIERHLAPETVELDCTPEEEARLLDGYIPALHRLRTGNRLILHMHSAPSLIEHLSGRERGHIVVRPTTLEDVFLALTGASLEGGA